MYKLFFPLVAVLFFACGDPATAGKTDSAIPGQHGMTVSDPLDPQPHAVQDSIFNGAFVDRYENGVIFMKGDVSGGLREGEWVTFYKSGKEWSRGIYKAGLREGYGVSFFENGEKSSEGYYKADKMVGKWKFWGTKGQMVEKDFGGK